MTWIIDRKLEKAHDHAYLKIGSSVSAAMPPESEGSTSHRSPVFTLTVVKGTLELLDVAFAD